MRAARGLLGWTQERLAKAAGVAPSTVKRMEALCGAVRANAGTLWKVQNALEAAGVEIIGSDRAGNGPGVRLKKDQP